MLILDNASVGLKMYLKGIPQRKMGPGPGNVNRDQGRETRTESHGQTGGQKQRLETGGLKKPIIETPFSYEHTFP